MEWNVIEMKLEEARIQLTNFETMDDDDDR